MRQERAIDPRERLRIVFEGLKEGVSVEDVCRRHDISSCNYYRWRNQVFRNAERIFRPRN